MDTRYIRERLYNNYNRAINNYNSQDYEGFFQSIRPAIEWLCQFLVVNFISDESLVEDLIFGNKKFIIEKGYRSLINCNEEPKSSGWIRLAQDAFFYSKQDSSHIEQFLKDEMEGYFKIMKSTFSNASTIGNHASYHSKNTETQARACANMFAAMFDSFRSNGILSKPALAFIEGLDKVEISDKREMTQMSKKLAEEEARRKNAEQENKEAVAIAEAAKRERDELLEEIRLAQEALAKKSAENADLHKKLATTKEKLETTTQKFGDLEQELDVLHECYSEALAQVDELEKKNQIQQDESVEEISLDELFEMEEGEVEEEVSLDNLFDMPEDDLLSESSKELEHSPNEDESDIKDRMVQKALKFIKQGLTPSQIIKEKRWRPINTYARLTKLVELGYYDARKFIEEETYDVIMNSITVLGSEADAYTLQDNCSKRVSLWQVKMILAELAYKEIIIPAQKQEINEWFFIKGLLFTKNKTSKWFFEKKYNHKCRVVRSGNGYYLQIGEEFIKLGNYDSAIRYYDDGSIWVKSDYGNKLGHPLVHAIGKTTYLIGHIRDSKQKIIFTTPDGEEKTITFS